MAFQLLLSLVHFHKGALQYAAHDAITAVQVAAPASVLHADDVATVWTAVLVPGLGGISMGMRPEGLLARLLEP